MHLTMERRLAVDIEAAPSSLSLIPTACRPTSNLLPAGKYMGPSPSIFYNFWMRSKHLSQKTTHVAALLPNQAYYIFFLAYSEKSHTHPGK